VRRPRPRSRPRSRPKKLCSAYRPPGPPARASEEKFEQAVTDARSAVTRAFKTVVSAAAIAQEREAYTARAKQGGTTADLSDLVKAGEKYAVIYADPPWTFEVYSGGRPRAKHRPRGNRQKKDRSNTHRPPGRKIDRAEDNRSNPYSDHSYSEEDNKKDNEIMKKTDVFHDCFLSICLM